MKEEIVIKGSVETIDNSKGLWRDLFVRVFKIFLFESGKVPKRYQSRKSYF